MLERERKRENTNRPRQRWIPPLKTENAPKDAARDREHRREVCTPTKIFLMKSQPAKRGEMVLTCWRGTASEREREFQHGGKMANFSQLPLGFFL
jgi:hypothetical protein